MRLIGEEGLDLAILPIGDNYTMGPDDALRAVKLLQPKKVLPIHYNTWAADRPGRRRLGGARPPGDAAPPVVLKPGEWTGVLAVAALQLIPIPGGNSTRS